MIHVAVAAIGLVVGFFAGLFGKGGSAVATPLLHSVGVPAIVAVAAPLPATIPSTAVAFSAYRRGHFVDGRVVRWSLAIGVPATIVGALLTLWISGNFLVLVTDVLVALLGIRFLFRPHEEKEVGRPPFGYRTRLAAVAALTGLISGLLANSGGFLLAPLYLVVLRMPVKRAFACSLAVAGVLAVPGTLVHWALGHINWSVVGLFAVTSVPLSYIGARVAIKTHPAKLERLYGAALAMVGVSMLVLAR